MLHPTLTRCSSAIKRGENSAEERAHAEESLAVESHAEESLAVERQWIQLESYSG